MAHSAGHDPIVDLECEQQAGHCQVFELLSCDLLSKSQHVSIHEVHCHSQRLPPCSEIGTESADHLYRLDPIWLDSFVQHLKHDRVQTFQLLLEDLLNCGGDADCQNGLWRIRNALSGACLCLLGQHGLAGPVAEQWLVFGKLSTPHKRVFPHSLKIVAYLCLVVLLSVLLQNTRRHHLLAGFLLPEPVPTLHFQQPSLLLPRFVFQVVLGSYRLLSLLFPQLIVNGYGLLRVDAPYAVHAPGSIKSPSSCFFDHEFAVGIDGSIFFYLSNLIQDVVRTRWLRPILILGLSRSIGNFLMHVNVVKIASFRRLLS